MTDHWAVIPALDTTTPNVARIWDAQLGGKDNFASDRRAAAAINEACREAGVPDGAAIARETRAWLRRAVRFLAEHEIKQFIDLGVGLPAGENVHQVARRHQSSARTVYVDNDDMVMAHGRALLARDRSTTAIQGDLRYPDEILRDAELLDLLNLGSPVAILLVAVLDLLPAEETIASAVAYLRAAVAPGSYLVITHTTSDNHPTAAAAVVEQYARLGVNTPITPRTGKEIAGIFDGWELVPPGLTPPARWHPELGDHDGVTTDTGWTYAGVGYLQAHQARPGLEAATAPPVAARASHEAPAERHEPSEPAGDRESGDLHHP